MVQVLSSRCKGIQYGTARPATLTLATLTLTVIDRPASVSMSVAALPRGRVAALQLGTTALL
jgi:hypothetical protein